MRRRLDLPWKQILLLTFWSFACVAPLLWSKGFNIVSDTFMEGTSRFWLGFNPYAAPVKGDVFHYSPFFAFAYGAFMVMPMKVHVLLFALLNSFVFWLGAGAWVRLEKKQPRWLWLGLIFCAMELDISMRYQQTNPMTIGLVLLSLAAFRDQAFARAGAVLALVVNLKIFPLIFCLMVLKPWNRRFALSLGATSLVLIALPCLAVGFQDGLQLHWEQIHAIASDLPSRHLQDLRSMLIRWNFPVAGEVLRNVVTGTAFILFPAAWIFISRSHFAWEEWVIFAVTTVLLFIPRTESPTFVFMAPAYLLLAKKYARGARAYILFCGFLGTFIFTSVWPPKLLFALRDHWTGKTLAAFLLWSFCTYFLARRLFDSKKAYKSAI